MREIGQQTENFKQSLRLFVENAQEIKRMDQSIPGRNVLLPGSLNNDRYKQRLEQMAERVAKRQQERDKRVQAAQRGIEELTSLQNNKAFLQQQRG